MGSPVSAAIFDEYNTRLQLAALKATRNALTLPSDLAFHRSMDSELAKDLDTFSSRVLSLTNNLLSLVSTSNSSQTSREKRKLKLEGQDDVVDNFHSLVVDSMDRLLERADICLDDYFGRTKPPAIVVNPKHAPQTKTNVPQGRLDPALQHASHLRKPQLSFKKKPDNSNDPWHPTLLHKYNAQVPLGYHYHDSEGESSATGITANTHPYHYEIKHISYPAWMFRSAPPISPRPFEEIPFTWVDTPAAFIVMLDKLRIVKELAVDLEYHSYRTYGGFLCLMQISTREQDWIIDTLLLRDELVELNEVFTDPKIVKVLHGADSDIVWLQQDLNLYIVNLFDTYHASKALDFPRHGLASLLEMYCDFTSDKRYQLADWRIRPLPEEMLLYARSDTHFLLYIYDNLRNALLDRAQSRAQSPQSQMSTSPPPNISHVLMKDVLSRSEETALRTYEKEVYDAECGNGSAGWDTLAKKWNKGVLLVPSVQRNVFLGVHGWRDGVAREEDESVRYVLPNHYLLRLAERPPADMAALMAVFHPVPPVIRRRAKELLDVIKATVLGGSSTSTDLAPRTMEAGKSTLPVEMEVDNVPSSPVGDGNASRLWGIVPRTSGAVVSTSSSSLFGSTLASLPIKAATSFSASSSFLFGPNKSTTYPISDGDDSRFRDLVARIHSKLVIAPSAPKVAVTTKEDADEATQTANGLGVQVEIPYVPPSHRQTIIPTVEDDTIVVVGQRQKKRKRVKPMPQDSGDRSGSVGTPQEEKAEGSAKKRARKIKTEEAVEPFDYSTVSNILDDKPLEPELRQRKKKPKQNKGGVLEYGDFPAPPRAHRELKSGNQSHTFK